MGEFHDAVTTLLDAFTSAIGVIKVQRGKRKTARVAIDDERKEAESYLSRSLKRSRRDVKHAYERDAKALGDGFRNGDSMLNLRIDQDGRNFANLESDEARSRLATILLRLNAGFITIINRFTRGKSSPADYEALINLSNMSRIDAMRTFEQLSYRVSQSNLSLIPVHTSPDHMKRKKRKPSKKGSSKAKSTPSLVTTSMGTGNSEGWVRLKHKRISSLDANVGKPSKRHTSRGHSKSTTHLATQITQPRSDLASIKEYSKSTSHLQSHQPLVRITAPAVTSGRTPNRQSLMSFASDSTKLGEIPAHRWMRPAMFENIDEEGQVVYPVTTFYPLEPYVEPAKRSVFRRLFRIP